MDNRPQLCKAVFTLNSIKNYFCLERIYQELFSEARNYWAVLHKTAPFLPHAAVVKKPAGIFSVDKPANLF
jgi:hypothetical protein